MKARPPDVSLPHFHRLHVTTKCIITSPRYPTMQHRDYQKPPLLHTSKQWWTLDRVFWRESGNISVAQDFLKSGVCFLLTDMLINPLTSSSLFFFLFSPRIPQTQRVHFSCLTCMIISFKMHGYTRDLYSRTAACCKKKSKKKGFYGREINENCLFLARRQHANDDTILKKSCQV